MFRGITLLSCVLSVALVAGCRAEEESLAADPGGPEGVPGGSVEAGGGGAGGTENGSGGSSSEGNQASIMAWNIEQFPLTSTAVDRAAAILTDLAPDVVALEEIAEPAAFDQLLGVLPDYDGILNDDPGAYLRLGLIYRRDRVTISEVETLFPSNSYAFPRPPLKAHVTIDAPHPIDLMMVVIHLKAQLDTESEARRREACGLLDEWVRDRLASGDEQEYVLLGDFNDKITDPPEWNVFGPFLNHPETYSALTMPLAQAGEHSYIPFESMIDHVFVTADMLTEIGTEETEVLHLEQTVSGYDDLTDHRPVRTWLSWNDR